MESNIRTMRFMGIDDWDRPVYKCLETGILWKDLANVHSDNAELYSCANSFDGEPCYPIQKDLDIRFEDKYVEDRNKFNYQMLSRLQIDCEYYLGNGNRYAGHLYYKTEQEHINAMKELYNNFLEDEKPEWLTYEQIEEYEKLMVI